MFKQIILSAVFMAFSGSSLASELNIDFHQRMESLHQQTSPELLTSEEFSELVDVAILSKEAELCDLNWEEQIYLPFMQNQRSGGEKSEKQLKYMGIMHGITMEMYEAPENFECEGLETKLLEQN